MLQRLFLLREASASPGSGRRVASRRGLLTLVAEQEEPVPARPGAQVAAVCGGHENGKWELLVDSTKSLPRSMSQMLGCGLVFHFIPQNTAWHGPRGPKAGLRDLFLSHWGILT